MTLDFDMDGFLARLKAVEVAIGTTRKEIAGKLDIKPQTFKNYVDGLALPNAKALAGLVQAFGINANWLLTGNGEMYVSASSQPVVVDPVLVRLQGVEAMLLRYGASPEEIRDAIKTALRAAEAPQENEPARDTQTATG